MRLGRSRFPPSYTFAGIIKKVIGQQEKPLVWIGSGKRDLKALPIPIRKFFGYALDFAQRGDKHDAAKVLKGFGSAGVMEIVEDGRDGTVPGRLRGYLQGSGIRVACVPEKEQTQHCNAQAGHQP